MSIYTQTVLPPDSSVWRGAVRVENADQSPQEPENLLQRLNRWLRREPLKGAYIEFFRFRGVALNQSRERALGVWVIFKEIAEADLEWYREFEVDYPFSARSRYMPVLPGERRTILDLLEFLELPENFL